MIGEIGTIPHGVLKSKMTTIRTIAVPSKVLSRTNIHELFVSQPFFIAASFMTHQYKCTSHSRLVNFAVNWFLLGGGVKTYLSQEEILVSFKVFFKFSTSTPVIFLGTRFIATELSSRKLTGRCAKTLLNHTPSTYVKGNRGRFCKIIDTGVKSRKGRLRFKLNRVHLWRLSKVW